MAVVSAAKDSRALGGDRGARVRLKWPNDIYLEVDGTQKKAGGILVNTSFSKGHVDIVIGACRHTMTVDIADSRPVGCGVNVSTPSPIASLSLLAIDDRRLDSETMLALILNKFERYWHTFVEGGGSWAPFEDSYLDVWLHS
jgi:biotin---protein ligase